MGSYNSDGQLAATATFVLEFFVNLLELEAKLIRLQVRAATFVEISAVLKRIALVLSNGKNMRFMFVRKDQIDAAIHAFLQTILERKLRDEAQGNDNDDEVNTLEAIAHTLRRHENVFVHETPLWAVTLAITSRSKQRHRKCLDVLEQVLANDLAPVLVVVPMVPLLLEGCRQLVLEQDKISIRSPLVQQVPATPGQTAGYGISLNTEVNVSDRPVTQQGMMGMRVGSAGPGRQVQDASFFKGKLHSKTAEITSEIEKLQREIEQDAKDKAQYAQLERKYETLAIEVRDLEGQLADYNLAMDKMRSATDPAEIRQVQEQLHQRNAREAEDVDRVFILRQEQEKNVRRMEDEMTEIHGKHQDKINQLAPQKLKRYQELLEEHHQTEVEIEARSQELELVMHAIHQKEAELSSDRYRDEYEALERQVRRLQKERDAAAEDAKTAQMDPAEARAVLLAKVKDDKSKMEALEGVLQEAAAEKQELNKALADLQSDLDERASGSDPAHKYEALFAKDKEMTEFLELFPAKKEAEVQSQRAAQGVIIQLLEHISAGMAKEDKLPGTNAANLEEMRKDLTFKERQLESSVTTKQRLTMELQKRQAELDKVNTLDAKIALELSSLLQKVDTMTADMTEFGKLDSLQEVHAQTKQHLLRLKKQYIGRRDAMRQQVTALSSQLENLVQATASQETAKNLDALEQKLRHHEQNIFHLKEYIDSKSREVDYEHLRQDCFRTLQDLNGLHVAQQQRQQQLNLGLVGGL
ncbi:hypothetical protein BBO99_00007432 [Phytophthora kernoviae]|uniref:IFT81 calponin homology domain-containing protein n=2 Tax=Phytophthora kernoviae TaxID=325452 RepID=A0A421GI98_9STRA|nr:hypothetical protein G195_008398 [Phytophthora kernoviae 00238/432]KAG2519448.1 hypothetical protein JM16_007098 [Phytophthora kernoviae]KAG2520742.1 hypothetical protein JM18_006965 [Phytophthora kernoviae]RLN32285.1 hypothetical protein BBI17_007371 [Phytophthora kernoviae]RLN76586.1 hypothetical protein BBO99_00007432 [Phytophthora kernoviae]